MEKEAAKNLYQFTGYIGDINTILIKKSELDSIRKDARRYQWLRQRVGYDETGPYFPAGRSKLDTSETDKFIDQAIEKAGG